MQEGRRGAGALDRARRDELANQDAVVEAARFGALVAARTVERPGASPPFLHELGLTAPSAPVAES